eukprot:1517276-Prymnesium_polylepis.1
MISRHAAVGCGWQPAQICDGCCHCAARPPRAHCPTSRSRPKAKWHTADAWKCARRYAKSVTTAAVTLQPGGHVSRPQSRDQVADSAAPPPSPWLGA